MITVQRAQVPTNVKPDQSEMSIVWCNNQSEMTVLCQPIRDEYFHVNQSEMNNFMSTNQR